MSKNTSTSHAAPSRGNNTKNPLLSLEASSALQRLKREQLFKAAIEHLVLLDCEAERESSLFNIGYCSDVVSLGALTATAQSSSASNSLEAEQRSGESEEDADVASEDPMSLIFGSAAISLKINEGKGHGRALNEQRKKNAVGDGEHPVDDPFATTAAAATKLRRRQRDDAYSPSLLSLSAPTVFNSAALDRALPSPQNWSFLTSSSSGTSSSSSANKIGPNTPAASILSQMHSGHNSRDTDPHYLWFRNRSGKLDRMKSTWAAELSPDEIARKVML